MTERLNEVLALYYKASVMGQGDTATIREGFIEEINEEPTLRQAAQAYLTTVETIPEKRCFISTIHKQFLKEILNG